VASLALIGLLGVAFAAATRLTGIDEDTANLATLGTAVDGRGLILAGLVIGALDDVTVTQASAVWELRATDPHQPGRQVFRAAMRIGRDHVAAAINTLVLAYAGSALPPLLLFSAAERELTDMLTTHVIATEVVRTPGRQHRPGRRGPGHHGTGRCGQRPQRPRTPGGPSWRPGRVLREGAAAEPAPPAPPDQYS
jgi:uncharacterized membrane protein